MNDLATYLAALADSQAIALIEDGVYRRRSYSYAELLGKAFALRDEFNRRGVGAGDKIIIWGAAGASWAIAFYACIFAGAVAVPAEAGYSQAFIERVQAKTSARLLCCPAQLAAALPASDPITFEAIENLAPLPPPYEVISAAPEALLQIVFTSGTTSDPKGVMITHGNLLANLRPIQHEVAKYKPKARLLLPLRFVHLIPLSHLFGQVMGLFIPTLLESAVVFPESQSPAALAACIKRHRASVLVAVPQQLELFLDWTRQQLARKGKAPGNEEIIAASQGMRFLKRWWHWRRLHRLLGWKFWAFIVGAATLPSTQEETWNALGYAVVQGYGLTETAPAVAITHPFKIRRGAVGKKLAGVEIRIAQDGEILVRGPNVSPGYFEDPEATGQRFQDGWLHTGDLGRLDEQGNLIFLSRKKDVIVTSEGLNVYPDEVERALEQEPEIAEAAVVSAESDGQRSTVHAVLVPQHRDLPPERQQEELSAAVARVNSRLERHQRLRGFTIWPQAALPRTAGTAKLQRAAVREWVRNGANASAAPSTAVAGDWRAMLAGKLGLPLERLRDEARLEELGFSSLDRIELLVWLEAHYGQQLSEAQLAPAETIGQLAAVLDPLWKPAVASAANQAETGARANSRVMAPKLGSADSAPESLYPAWPHAPTVRTARTLAREAVMLPLLRTVAQLEIEGREHLRGLRRPLMFVSNHQSLLDVPAILRALPWEWRPWLAPMMGAETFAAAWSAPHTAAARLARRRIWLLRSFLNTYLLGGAAGVQGALRHSGWLVERGYCPLLFPEGRRTTDGALQAFRPGVGVFVHALRLPVVPIVLDGLYDILPTGAEHAKRGRALVRIAPAWQFETEGPEEITAKLQQWYQQQPELR